MVRNSGRIKGKPNERTGAATAWHLTGHEQGRRERDVLAKLPLESEGERPASHREELLTFHGTSSEACHDPVLEDHNQDDQGDGHHHGSCHDRAPGLFIRCCTAKL
jgi:hypothetical protein